MIWSEIETLPREEMEKIQLERLKETVARVYERVEPYRRKMDEAGIAPSDIKSLADLRRLPFTFLNLKNGGTVDFNSMSEILFSWAKKWISEAR